MMRRWQQVARDMRRFARLQDRALRRVRAILSRAGNGLSWHIAGNTSIRTWELLPTGWWSTGADSRREDHPGRELSTAEQDSLLRAERAMVAAGYALRNQPIPTVYDAAELERALDAIAKGREPWRE